MLKPIGLIAANYVREQRWAVILLLAWVALSALLAGLEQLERTDVLFFIQQQAIYGVAFSGFLAASSIYNERRSRRILAVLSKGIDRRQYLAGLLGGVLLTIVLYLIAMGTLGGLMFTSVGIPRTHLWQMLALLLVACALTATTGLLFATFAPPIVAVACTAVTLGSGVALAQIAGARNFLPVYALLDAVIGYANNPHWSPPWTPAMWAIAQTALLWLLASAIFARRDIAVAVE
jgi:ABC-type transport system involved in multi-copper enzyme maturation permease subunit